MADDYMESLVSELEGAEKISNLDGKVSAWLSLAHGEFRLSEIIKDLGIKNEEDISDLKFALYGLCCEGRIKENKSKNGVYRKIEVSLEKMKRVENRPPPIDLWLPFGLHEKYVPIPGALILVSGVRNAGKSTFMLNFCENNMHKHKIRYVSSEWSNVERDIQLEDFGADIDQWDSKIDFYAKKDVSTSFDNYIDPENITIIDYFENYDNYAAVAGGLRDIADKLTTGIAIVALQKKANSDYGFGGEATLNRAQLSINIDVNELTPSRKIVTVTKLKKSVDRRYNIERLSREFEYNSKGRIVGLGDWGKIIERKKNGEILEKYVQGEAWANMDSKKDRFEWDE